MKITCALSDFDFGSIVSDLDVILYGKANTANQGSIGATLRRDILRKKLVPASRAWDFLSIALAVISADTAGHRKLSPDGWTRTFELTISVNDVPFWQGMVSTLNELLAFLTTDRWSLKFIEGGLLPSPPSTPNLPVEDCAALLSGGLDSLIGIIDLVTDGEKPYAVSQRVTGDTDKQTDFSKKIGGGVNVFQVNHNVRVPNRERPQSQRARSIIFMAYGILIATSLKKYHDGANVPLYVCENGFISINPSLTTNRVGSLSTRTTHPVIFGLLQKILDQAKLNVTIINPYRFKTKGEMLKGCKDQVLLGSLATKSTSCGRFLVNKLEGKYVHCGRCVPCQVRRAAFEAWRKEDDETKYFYHDLGKNDEKHAGFDDVRSMLIAISEAKEQGVQRWLGASLSSALIQDKNELSEMVKRGLLEIETFLKKMKAQ